jgi:hypothetical protein
MVSNCSKFNPSAHFSTIKHDKVKKARICGPFLCLGSCAPQQRQAQQHQAKPAETTAAAAATAATRGWGCSRRGTGHAAVCRTHRVVVSADPVFVRGPGGHGGVAVAGAVRRYGRHRAIGGGSCDPSLDGETGLVVTVVVPAEVDLRGAGGAGRQCRGRGRQHRHIHAGGTLQAVAVGHLQLEAHYPGGWRRGERSARRAGPAQGRRHAGGLRPAVGGDGDIVAAAQAREGDRLTLAARIPGTVYLFPKWI